MKKLYTILIAVIITASAMAQAPEKMSYQAVVRDASNTLVTSQAVGMQISILQGNATGTPVYAETQSPTTNTNGLVSLEIGNGTIISGDFTTIDWANGPYFIKTETDPTGGTNYTISGTSQLLSVPYALYAVSSGSSIPGSEGPAGADGAIGATGPQGPAGTDGLGVAQTLSQSGNTITLSDGGGSVSITDNDTQLDAAGVTALGFVSGAHTIDTNTQLDEAAVGGFVANNGYLTTEVDGSTTNEIQDLQLATNILTITNNGAATTIDLSPYLDNTDTQLDETAVDAFVTNNGYLTTEVDGSVTNEIELPTSGNAGDMNYWDGGAWVTIPATPNEGATLQMISGIPAWTGGTPPPPPPAIGDFRNGGVVFWLDGSGGGLVCAIDDQSSGIQWYNGVSTITGATATAIGTGQANTTTIISNQGGGSYAAQLYNDLVENYYYDWYLPSKDELNEMYLNKATIDATAIANEGGGFASSGYWSSTENDSSSAWEQFFFNGNQYGSGKGDGKYVRAVRAF